VNEPAIKLKLPANEPQRTHTGVGVEKTGSDEWTITVTATYTDGYVRGHRGCENRR
jgi:hypothetical protein